MEIYNNLKLAKLTKIIGKLNLALNSWLIENNFNTTVLFADHFEYDYLNQIISYTLFEDGINNELFLNICNSIYKHDYDIFIISFLHELGHYATADKITTKDLEEKLKFEDLEKPSTDDELAYFVSFSEWEATNWACNFIKDNPEKIENLSTSLEEARVEFFEYIKEENRE